MPSYKVPRSQTEAGTVYYTLRYFHT